jgi:acyl carrier protein
MPRDLDTASLEQAVAEIWCDILDLTVTKPGEDFMASGGDSIQLLQLISRVQSEFGMELSLVEFLKEPTVESVVAAIAAQA